MVWAFMVWTYLMCLTIEQIDKHHESSLLYSLMTDSIIYFAGMAQTPTPFPLGDY